MPNKKMKIVQEPVRAERLGFRLDEQAKELIERDFLNLRTLAGIAASCGLEL